ncbi:MAG: XdhC family protein, partial [Xanthobacteraceae bacterium]
MRLDLLSALNAERAARRAVVLVTDTESGAQRLVKAADISADPLKGALERHLRSGKSGMEEAGGERFFITDHVPP